MFWPYWQSLFLYVGCQERKKILNAKGWNSPKPKQSLQTGWPDKQLLVRYISTQNKLKHKNSQWSLLRGSNTCCLKCWCIIARGTEPTILQLDKEYIGSWSFAKLPYYLHQSNGSSPCNGKILNLKWNLPKYIMPSTKAPRQLWQNKWMDVGTIKMEINKKE